MASSVIRLICPNLRCRAILAVPTSARGKMVRCRNCATRIQVPAPTARDSPASSPQAANEVADPTDPSEKAG